jgi:NAD(P)-dependent dehydrogenase (short-subunit alcohol dehydrogenase family)
MLNGKSAFITGGSRGIGLAIARALVEQGVNVTITARTDESLAAAKPLLERAGPGRVEALRADVADYAASKRAVDAAASRFEGLDVIVNNAGVGNFARIADMTPDHWARVIGTNLTGVYNVCHAAIPHLRQRGSGFIINISSLAGTNFFPGGGAYCASKAALNAFSEILMQELRYDDIRVSYVMPGSVATDFTGSDDKTAADWKIAPGEVADVVLNLLRHHPRSLPSRVELRPAKPARK